MPVGKTITTDHAEEAEKEAPEASGWIFSDGSSVENPRAPT